MKGKGILIALVLGMAVNIGLLRAGEIHQVRSFQTWNSISESGSTDPAGIVYHNGYLFISDSEIDEIDGAWDCKNIFEFSLDGNEVFQTFDAYVNGGLSCAELLTQVHPDGTPWTEEERKARRIRDREPTGITYNEYNGLFYITNDDRTRMMRYDAGFGMGFGQMFVQNTDLEDITSDPSGNLYVVVGLPQPEKPGPPPVPATAGSRVLVYSSELIYQYEFSMADKVGDPEGIAYNQQLDHLFVVSQADLKVFEYTLGGDFIDDYDISGLDPAPMDPQGLTFAPSSDPNDNPDQLSLYIVDGQVDNGVDPNERDGVVYEVQVISAIDYLVNSSFTAGKYGSSGGNVYSNGNIEFTKGSPSTFGSNLTAVGDIMIGNDNTIDGDATAGGMVSVSSSAQVMGTTIENASVATMVLPVVSVSAGGTDVNVPKNETEILPPDSYGNVLVGNGSTLRLSSGQYYFETIDLQQSAILEVNVAGGAVTVSVVDTAKFHKNTQVIINGVGGTPYFTLRQAGSTEISIDNGSSFNGSIIAPLATVRLNKDAAFQGSIIADAIEVGNNASLNPHPAALSLASVSTPKNETETPEITSSVIPSAFSLSQNYPNPFNPETQISFHLPVASHAAMTIYNARGQEILKLFDNTYAEGSHTVRWDGKDSQGNPAPSGVYFYQLKAGNFSQVKKMSLLK